MSVAWSGVTVTPAQADFDASGRVDFSDFLHFASMFGKFAADPDVDSRADLDGSGRVDFSDFLLFAGVFGRTSAVSGEVGPYTDRFVFVSRSLLSDSDLDAVKTIVDTASANGLNGIMLSAGWDQADLRPPAFWDRVVALKAYAAARGMEIIPLGFSAGYGGGVLAHNPHLAAGLPLVGSRYDIVGTTGTFLPDPAVAITNGGFEQFTGNTAIGYTFHDKPGEISFADYTIRHAGIGSLRFENVGLYNPDYGHARVMQEVAVKPNRQYRVSCWVKTRDLNPVSAFQFLVLSGDRTLATNRPEITGTMAWTELTFSFNSLDLTEARLYVGQWGGQTGTLWIDDWQIEELGPVNVLRRPGTPVTVRGALSGITYTEGVDYEPFVDPEFSLYSTDHQPPPLKVIIDGRLDRLNEDAIVDVYQPVRIDQWQVPACMSEPEVYDIWRRQVELIEQYLAPDKYLLSMDEVRAGGSCLACKNRGISMGEILGDCITQQFEMIREVNPDATVYVWSDMLDPNHNAHGDYYLVDGDFTGSWNHVPKDLVICTWYHAKRDLSLPFFSGEGFSTMAGAYYDGDDLTNINDWMTSMAEIQGARGIMYTTWQNKYELLGAFGRAVSARASGD